jgi:hypothetical protein
MRFAGCGVRAIFIRLHKQGLTMRIFASLTAAGFMLAGAAAANAVPISPNGLSNAGTAVVHVQAKKEEGIVQRAEKKVKRAWRNLAGYKFDVACPAMAIPLSRASCTETGKNVEEARSKCQAKHALCQVVEAK